jgi:DNA-binding transcriptional MerR regulator
MVHDTPALSAGAAARRLGVAPETLRSWDRRYGLGPHGHQPGAHRRYTPSDIARLESVCRLVAEGVPVAEAASVVLADRAEPATVRQPATPAPATRAPAGGGHTLPIGREGASVARGLARCAIRLDAPQILELLETAFARDGVAAVWHHTIEPALRAVGRKWTETHGRYVEVEHLLSWCVTVALHRVLPPRPTTGWSRGRGVLLACAPGEWHSLPMEVLTAALTQHDTPVRMLGAAVPGEALQEAARRTWPTHILVWSHSAGTADPALLARLSSQQPGTQIIAAGNGWAGRTPPGITVVRSLQQAIDACGHPVARDGERGEA